MIQLRSFLVPGSCLGVIAAAVLYAAQDGAVRAQRGSPQAGAASAINVTVHEGTSMAIALSPDKRTLVIDLQGSLWTLPASGGAARRITDEYNDARQPSWSPDGARIAYQSYRDGTWRLATVAPDGSGMKALTSGPFDGAHRLGIATSSHEIYPAALFGADSVEHTGATSRRGYSPKRSGMGRSYEDVIQIVAKSRMTLTPTSALGGFQAAAAGDPSLLRDPRMTALQPSWVLTGGGGRGGRGGRGAPAGAADPRSLHTFMQRSARTLMDLLNAGVPIIAGVDSPLAPYGASLHVEMAAYVEAGFTPFQALKTATVNTAALLNVQSDLGTIEPGKLADMVIVEGNPLENIRDTVKVKKVIKNGEVLTVDELLNAPRPAAPSAGGPR